MPTLSGIYATDAGTYRADFTRWVIHAHELRLKQGELSLSRAIDLDRRKTSLEPFRGRIVQMDYRNDDPSDPARYVSWPRFERDPAIWDLVLQSETPRPLQGSDFIVTPRYDRNGRMDPAGGGLDGKFELVGEGTFAVLAAQPVRIEVEPQYFEVRHELASSFEAFSRLEPGVLSDATKLVHDYYSGVTDDRFDRVEQVWEHVTPLFVQGIARENEPWVVVYCEVDWYDNGLSLAFRDGKALTSAMEGTSF